MPYTSKAEYERQLELAGREIARLKKQSTRWMIVSVIGFVLFAITLAMLFARG